MEWRKILYCPNHLNKVKMKYLYLALAILFEVVGSGFLKASDGFSKIVPTGITLVAYLICFYFFSLALKQLPLGLAYAV